MADSGQRLTLTAYAKQRGCSTAAVSVAIKKGRLVKSVGRDAWGKPYIADPVLADREWNAKTDHSKAPFYVREREAARLVEAPAEELQPPKPGGSLAENNAARAYWQARQAELDYRKEAGELVPAAEVRGKLEGVFLRCRTKLLGLPSRARQQLPGLTTSDIAALEALVREALEDLAAGGGI